MKINELIKKIRLENNISQKELAKKLGVSMSMLQKYEYGDYKIKFEILEKYNDIFNISIVEMLKNENINTVDFFIENSELIELNENLLVELTEKGKNKKKIYRILENFFSSDIYTEIEKKEMIFNILKLYFKNNK